jgi:hypothetical protein
MEFFKGSTNHHDLPQITQQNQEIGERPFKFFKDCPHKLAVRFLQYYYRILAYDTTGKLRLRSPPLPNTSHTQNVPIAVKQFIITGRKHDVGPFLSSSLVPLQNDPFRFLLFVLGNQKGGQRRPHPSPTFGPKLLILDNLSHAVLQWGFNSCNLCSLHCSNLYYCVCP